MFFFWVKARACPLFYIPTIFKLWNLSFEHFQNHMLQSKVFFPLNCRKIGKIITLFQSAQTQKIDDWLFMEFFDKDS